MGSRRRELRVGSGRHPDTGRYFCATRIFTGRRRGGHNSWGYIFGAKSTNDKAYRMGFDGFSTVF